MSTPPGKLRLVELSTRLPVPLADDRVEVFDPVRKTLVTFPGHRRLPPDHPRPREPQVPPAKLFSRKVWSAAVTGPATRLGANVSAFVPEPELPGELAFGSYWGRAVFSGDGRHLYLTGPFDTHAIYLATVQPGGRLGPWRATRPMPPSPRGRRSLHQVFISGGRLFVFGGWFADARPGIRQIHAAPLGKDGAVGEFSLQTARLPFAEAAFSLARCDGQLFLARGDTIWSSTLDRGGALTPFQKVLSDPRLKHQQYGGTGMACCGARLALVDEDQTHILIQTARGLRLVQSLKHPAPFSRRTVFCHGGRFFITTTHGGRIYSLATEAP